VRKSVTHLAGLKCYLCCRLLKDLTKCVVGQHRSAAESRDKYRVVSRTIYNALASVFADANFEHILHALEQFQPFADGRNAYDEMNPSQIDSTPTLSAFISNCRNSGSAFSRHCRQIEGFVTGLFVALLYQRDTKAGEDAMSHHYSGPDWGFPHGDARLDLTDLYAFPKPGDAGKSILIMNVHPSAGENPPGPTTTDPFAPEALYELKIDTDGDAVADIAYRVRFSSFEGGSQTATLRRVEGVQAAGSGDSGQVIVESAPVSTGREARVTEAGEYRFFAGWRSDPFFFDRRGALKNLQFTGDDFFADKNVCSIVLEVPNLALAPKEVGLWHRTLVPAHGADCITHWQRLGFN
jgi:hypothetical protein